jgi:hypothetical protein
MLKLLVLALEKAVAINKELLYNATMDIYVLSSRYGPLYAFC